MRVLGIDPGLRVTGYAVLEISSGSSTKEKIHLVEAGVIRTKNNSGVGARLGLLHRSIQEIIGELKPDCVAIEKLYAHYKHPTTAILMGHARGVVCALSGLNNLPLVNIASTHVKKAVSGHGHAGKWQIQKMIQHKLGLAKVPEPPDVADAIAVAMAAGAHSTRTRTT